MRIEAAKPEEYIKKIPAERKDAFNKLRQVIRENLPEGFNEAINYGMIGYVVPLSEYPEGYLNNPDQPLPFISIANQKNFIGFYHMGMYMGDKLYDWFKEEYSKTTKYKVDMGKSCLRLKRMNEIPYELIGEVCRVLTADEWVDIYKESRK